LGHLRLGLTPFERRLTRIRELFKLPLDQRPRKDVEERLSRLEGRYGILKIKFFKKYQGLVIGNGCVALVLAVFLIVIAIKADDLIRDEYPWFAVTAIVGSFLPAPVTLGCLAWDAHRSLRLLRAESEKIEDEAPGFVNVESSMGGKWLELLNQIAPSVRRAGMIFDPDTAPGRGLYYLTSFEAAARSFRIESIAVPVHSEADLETTITSLGREPRGGLIVTPDVFSALHRAAIILFAAQHNVPAVYWNSDFTRYGGLLGYGADQADLYRRAASYVDRILHGAKPADLPVQAPVKFEMAINLKTAKTLGIVVPQSILLRADEVIE
jgi:hypothetical protein